MSILLNRTQWHSQARVKLIGKDDPNLISDTTLDYWSDLAERLIKKKISTWSTILTAGGDNKEFLIDATICQVCAMYVTPLRNIVANDVKIGEIAEKRDIDFDKLEADLYAEVDFFASQITTATVSAIKRVGVISPTETMYESLD
uniref:Uncharacterized protein n=1 Tax=viral metagenome TaxID=1070528 RepID=A0A6H1ZAL5_9ZZZZ